MINPALIYQTNNRKMFKKNDRIKLKDGYFVCIIANKELAIFAPTNKGGTKIKFKNMFAINPKAKTDDSLGIGLL